MLSDLDSLNVAKISFAIASMQANIESLASTIFLKPGNTETELNIIKMLYDYTAVVGMDTLTEYAAEGTADGFELSIAELNTLLGNTLIDNANYQEALDRVISQESIPVDNSSDVNEQFYLFQNQITSDVYVEYASAQAAGDKEPYIQIAVDENSEGEIWDVVYKLLNGTYATILDDHVITSTEAAQGFIFINDGTGPVTVNNGITGDGYINVVKNGETVPVSADYYFDYQ